MKTLEMMNKAQEDKKFYIIDEMRYSAKRGFHDRNGEPWDVDGFSTVDEIMDIDGWKELEPERMTLEEIENALGYPVQIILSE